MDVLNFGTDETQVRYTFDSKECMMLMDACAALREARFPGLLKKLPRHFDEGDLAKVLGVEEAAEAMAIFEAEHVFHQALHIFPGGHDHGDDDDHDHDHDEDEDGPPSARTDADDE